MKTIEEAAIKHASYFRECKNCEKDEICKKNIHKEMCATFECEYKGFKAGVEFSQEWISVEDELPKQGQEVLIKFKGKQSEYMTSCISAFYDYKTFRNSFGTLIYDKVEFWRPIELK